MGRNNCGAWAFIEFYLKIYMNNWPSYFVLCGILTYLAAAVDSIGGRAGDLGLGQRHIGLILFALVVQFIPYILALYLMVFAWIFLDNKMRIMIKNFWTQSSKKIGQFVIYYAIFIFLLTFIRMEVLSV